MPIDTQCPHCKKPYRLKDELAGKRVNCAACRKPFPVPGPPSANGPARPPAKSAEPVIDTEALAAAAFADDPSHVVPEDQRTIAVVCAGCDHKWDVPWAMQGKNVLCPDCRHRQKVPIQNQKKVDWQNPNAGRPSMAKVEELEGVVASTQTRGPSGDTLRKTGVIEDDVEPRPRWQYYAAGGGLVTLLACVAFGLFLLFQEGKEDTRNDYMADALIDMRDAKDAPLPPAEAPLFRAALELAAGEFAARHDDPKQLEAAIAHFGKARQELDAAPKSDGRGLLLAELAVAQVSLGGDEEQVTAGTRIRWTPQTARNARVQVNSKTYNVQEELRQTLNVLRKDDKAVNVEVRLLAIRRLTKALAARGQPGLTGGLVSQGFGESEQAEAAAQVVAEAMKAGSPDAMRDAAEQLKTTVSARGPDDHNPRPVTAQAVWQALGIIGGPTLAPDPRPSGEVPDATRQAYTARLLLQGQPDEARELANRPGAPASRCKALALVAEWSDNPAAALDQALAVVSSLDPKKKDGPSVPDITLLRLALAAAKASKPDHADGFVKAMGNDAYRAWAKGEGLRLALAADGKAADEAKAEVPTDAKDHRVGHAWGRLALARHNARVTNNDPPGSFDRWGSGSFKPFGLAGVALGLQDRTLR